MPAKIRNQWPCVIVITIKYDFPCLVIHTQSGWNTFEKSEERTLLNINARQTWRRFIYAWMSHVNVPKDGRFLLMPYQTKYAKLSNNCVLMGKGDHLELWDEATLQAYMKAKKLGPRVSLVYDASLSVN